MISSVSNGKVKKAAALGKKAKYRRETGLYVVEGPKMAFELPEDEIECVYVTENFLRSYQEIAKKMRKLKCMELVTDEVMKAMSDTESPQGILAVARQHRYEMKDILKRQDKAHLIILETLQDPGNLGTIMRTAEAAGVSGIVMDRGTADIYSPKVIRSTMGAIFRMPFVYVEDLKSSLKEMKQAGICLYAAHLEGAKDYDKEDYTRDMGFLIGNEAKGLSADITFMADACVKIPMSGKVESLNAAVAASVFMFEAARQRRSLGCQ
ncbi:MAG: RNA methyltransferase [Hungatella sp.]|nr:RNA methyltransferase [Hungatella sp.]